MSFYTKNDLLFILDKMNTIKFYGRHATSSTAKVVPVGGDDGESDEELLPESWW